MNFIQDYYNFITGEDYFWLTNILRTLAFVAGMAIVFVMSWWIRIVFTDLNKTIKARLKTGETNVTK